MAATAEPISKMKIILPRRRMDLLSRPRLLEILNERLDRKLIIISAAAGYGKTSLLIDLAWHSDLPFCWLALDPLDCEPQRFIAYLIASLSERFAQFGKRSRSLLDGMTSLEDGMERVLVTLVNEIFDDIHEHFVLVLDDFHVLDKAAPVLYFVNRFVQLVGENCHLAIASRTLPPLKDIPLLVARDEVGGLDFEDLAFRPEELQALLAQNKQIHLSDQDAQKLVNLTEGWITGLQFTDLRQLSGGVPTLQAPQKVGVTVFDYLGQQVLEQQPKDLQEFLLRSSMLEEFDAGLCEEVLGPLYADPQDWPALIESLTQRNLFTLPVGNNGQWLRYHHLFRDYLQARLRSDRPEEVVPILRRLAQSQEKSGEWEKAYQIYRALGEAEVLAGMIERAGIPMYQHAMLTLDSWLKALPPSIASNRPGILSLRANVETLKGNAKEAVTLFHRAIELFRANKDEEGLALALVRRGIAYRALGRYEEAIRDADEMLQRTEGSDRLQWIYADGLRLKGVSLYRQGNSLEALNYLQHAYDVYQREQDSGALPHVLMDIGMIEAVIGSYPQAKGSYEKAIKILREQGNLSLQANLLNNYGVLHQQLGEYEEAVSALEEGLLCARQSGFKRMEALVALSLGDVYTEVEDFEIASQTYLQASEPIEQLGDPFLNTYLILANANVALLRGDTRRARELLAAVTPAVHLGKSNYEIGLLQLMNGRLELQNRRAAKALPALKEARRCFNEDGREMEGTWSAVWLAAAEHQAGGEVAARELIRKAVPNANQINHAAVVATRQARDCLAGLRKDPELRSYLRVLFDKIDRLDDQLPRTRRLLRRLAHTIEMPMPSLVIKAFGPGQVWVNGRLLGAKDWQTQSVRELFFFFLASGRPLGREQIGAALWPATDEPSKAKVRFRNEIYRLRRAVGQETILFDGGEYYQFNSSVDHEYDVEAFESYLRKARFATAPGEQIDFYERAIGLVQGKYLEDATSSWVMPEQERLRQAYLTAAATLGELYLKDGQAPKAIEVCERALSQDTTHEALYRALMEVYARLGDKASVAHVYKKCEDAFRNEFAMPPSQETRELYRNLTA